MKTAWLIVIILLLLSLTFNWVQWDRGNDRKLTADLAESQSVLRIKEADARTAKRDTAIARLQFKMDSASQYHAKVQGTLLEAINAKKGYIAKLPPITAKSDSNQVKAAIHARDSLIGFQDKLIGDLTTERNGIQADCKALTDSLLANINDLRGIRIELESQVQRRNEALTVEKKKVKGWKIITGAVVVLYVIDKFRE